MPCSSALDQGQGCVAATAAGRYLGALQRFLGTGISESAVQIMKEKTERKCSSALRLQGVRGPLPSTGEAGGVFLAQRKLAVIKEHWCQVEGLQEEVSRLAQHQR